MSCFHNSIKEDLWPQLSGTDHHALINFFAVLKSVDEKAPFGALTAAEHIKLLKKAKAASSGKLPEIVFLKYVFIL